MHSSHLSIEPLGDELGACARLVQTGFDDVILMDAVRDIASPQRDPPEFLAASIAFNEQHIILLQSIHVHLLVGHIDRLNLTQAQIIPLHVGNTEIEENRGRVLVY